MSQPHTDPLPAHGKSWAALAGDYAGQVGLLQAELNDARRDVAVLRGALQEARMFVGMQSLGQSRTHRADSLLKRIIDALAATAVRTDALPGAADAPAPNSACDAH